MNTTGTTTSKPSTALKTERSDWLRERKHELENIQFLLSFTKYGGTVAKQAIESAKICGRLAKRYKENATRTK